MSTKITVLPNGPILVAGEIELIGVDGKPIQLPNPQAALCRCGLSKVKPFCDGAHRAGGFKDPAPSA